MATLCRGGIESRPVIRNDEQKSAVLLPQTDLDSCLRRMLRRVLECLEAAEVESGLRLGRIPANALGHECHRQRAAVARGAQRLDQSAVHEERRIDTVR